MNALDALLQDESGPSGPIVMEQAQDITSTTVDWDELAGILFNQILLTSTEALEDFHEDSFTKNLLNQVCQCLWWLLTKQVGDLHGYTSEIEKELWQLELDSIPDCWIRYLFPTNAKRYERGRFFRITVL